MGQNCRQITRNCLHCRGLDRIRRGAIASIAYDIKVPAVDGNVLRVMMRYQASLEDITKMPVRRRVESELTEVMPERPGDFNQAIMELGEVVCIPNGMPLCDRCPLAATCEAKQKVSRNNIREK